MMLTFVLRMENKNENNIEEAGPAFKTGSSLVDHKEVGIKNPFPRFLRERIKADRCEPDINPFYNPCSKQEQSYHGRITTLVDGYEVILYFKN